MYLYHVAINENTQELRQELIQRGLRAADNDLKLPVLLCKNGLFYSVPYINQITVNDPSFIGLPIQDKRLFLAIASINSDHNNQQWFVVDEEITCLKTNTTYKKGDFVFIDSALEYERVILYFHKATPMELIKYFKNLSLKELKEGKI